MSLLPLSALVVISLVSLSVGAREPVKCYQSNWNGAHPPITGDNGKVYKPYNGAEFKNQLQTPEREQHKIILRTCDPDVTHCLSIFVKLRGTTNGKSGGEVKLHQVKCALSKKETAAGFKDDYGVCDLAKEWLPALNCTIEYENRKKTPDGGRMKHGKCDARDNPAEVLRTGVLGSHHGCNVPIEVKEQKGNNGRMRKRRRHRGRKRKQHQQQQQQADSEGDVMQGGDVGNAMSDMLSSLFAKRNRRSAALFNSSVETSRQNGETRIKQWDRENVMVEQDDKYRGVNGIGDILEAPFVIDKEEVRRGVRSLLISHFGEGGGSAEGSEAKGGSRELKQKRSADATVPATPAGNEKTKAVKGDDSNSKPDNAWIIIPITEMVVGFIIVCVFVAVVLIARSKGRNSGMRKKKRVRGSKESGKKSGFDEEDDEEEGKEEVERAKKGILPEDDPDCWTWMKEKVTGGR